MANDPVVGIGVWIPNGGVLENGCEKDIGTPPSIDCGNFSLAVSSTD